MPSTAPQIDHIIILLPYADILSPPAWLTSNFTVSPGGRHADNKTENRLIPLADGSYIELIAFINDDPARRAGHWWDKPYGIVDWALTSPSQPEEEVKGVNARLEKESSDVRYAEPIQGGRKRPDGVEMEWKVTFPVEVGRGFVPFWCHDVTERGRRVPGGEEATRHPCGALGLAGVRVGVEEGKAGAVREAVRAIVDGEGDGKFEIGAPNADDGLERPWAQVEGVADVKDGGVPRIEIVLQTSGGQGDKAPRDIHQRVGEGEVAILFR